MDCPHRDIADTTLSASNNPVLRALSGSASKSDPATGLVMAVGNGTALPVGRAMKVAGVLSV